MSEEPRIVVLGGARTPVGSFGGVLKDVPAHLLGAAAARAAMERVAVAPEEVQRATDVATGDDRAHRGRFPDHHHVVGGEKVGDGELHHRPRLLDRRRAGHALQVAAGEDQIRQGNDHLSQTVTGPATELRRAIDRR